MKHPGKLINSRRALLTTMLILAALLPLQHASAIPVIDQEQPIIDATAAFIYAVGGGSEQQLAQVITTGISGFLVQVGLPVGTDSGDLVVEVQGVAGGIPDGTVLTSEAFPAPVPFPSGFTSLPFSSPVFFGAGDLFAIVLRSTGAGGLSPGPLGDPYPGGDAFFIAEGNPPGWLPLTEGLPPSLFRFDLPFQTLVEPSAVPEPSTLLLVVSGLAGLGMLSRRCRR